MSEPNPSSTPSDQAPSEAQTEPQTSPIQSAAKSTEIRRGSPFAAGTDRPALASAYPVFQEEVWVPESGMLQSSVVAALIVLVFSIACWRLFPAGGILVTGLGCGLSILGMFSSRAIGAVVCLIAHSALFAACYMQMM
ncbi:hypothetical protein [Rhodopirellula bahusiensis]|uniref:Uncharacterized protein n=1 Tax=Rhodopirellula bahusiensis TaxID=2014065 RepID=A0A2G1WCT2_9BACT|nr:hypothetical protein [Rhodopirellula bahusiensis]PHQ36806.1 hypothetical protein CEE69_04210 [Rhodopirellula bahusiensis]